MSKQQLKRDEAMLARRRAARRRRRQRQRERRKLATSGNGQSSRNTTGQKFPDEPRAAAPRRNKLALDEVMSADLQRYCEAVTNPFGPEAIGALLPDRYQELIIPCVDRHEFDLDYTAFNAGSADWSSHDFSAGGNAGAFCQLIGAIVWFQPRCLEAGLISTFSRESGGAEQTGPLYPPFIDNQGTTGGYVDEQPLLHQYNLCYTGVWYIDQGPNATHSFSGIRAGLFMVNAETGPPLVEFPVVRGYRVVAYPRIYNIGSNCSKGRILGAGIKVWSEEAPIATGGYCIGGWSTFSDVLDCFKNQSWNVGSYSAGQEALEYATIECPATQTATGKLPQTIKGACRQPGVKGVTVRYSALQTPDQVEQEAVSISDDLYYTVQSLATLLPGNDGDDTPYAADWEQVVPEQKVDMSAYDVITAGSYIPVIYWKFNIAPNTLVATSVENIYTLRVMSMVHFEGTPTGDSPFMSHKLNVDYAYNQVKMLLENWEEFPPAVAGHSFKSFLKKAAHVVGKVTRGVSHFANIMSLVDGYIAPLL